MNRLYLSREELEKIYPPTFSEEDIFKIIRKRIKYDLLKRQYDHNEKVIKEYEEELTKEER